MHEQRSMGLAMAILALCGLAGLVSPARALQEGGSTAAEDRAAVWRAQLGEAHAMLSKEEYEAARDLTRRLADDMLEHLGAGDEAEYTMAVVAAFRAIAEVGLGQREEGLWYWRIATTLHPSFAERDLTVYGDPAIWLTEQKYRAGYAAPPASSALMEPRTQTSRPVELPGSMADVKTDSVSLVVETIVGMNGEPREPRVVSAPEVPALIYAALEGLKDWRFLPATLDGKPVAMAHQVTVELGG